MKIILAQPRGFCAGVERAIDIVEEALRRFGAPIYVRHEIVHNRHVVQRLRDKGVVFVDELTEVPQGAITIFSAHGVADAVVAEAEARALPVIDATCPLVTKVHNEGARYAREGREVVLIGHEGHPEVEGTKGRIAGKVHVVGSVAEIAALSVQSPQRLAYVTQTTLSVDDTKAIIAALKARFPEIVGPETKDICYATQNRQEAVRELAKLAPLVLVIGAPNSSNSNRLVEIARECGAQSFLIEDASGLEAEWFAGLPAVGITAGASAPEDLVQAVTADIVALTGGEVTSLDVIKEDVFFHLPMVLRDDTKAAEFKARQKA